MRKLCVGIIIFVMLGAIVHYCFAGEKIVKKEYLFREIIIRGENLGQDLRNMHMVGETSGVNSGINMRIDKLGSKREYDEKDKEYKYPYETIYIFHIEVPESRIVDDSIEIQIWREIK